MSVYINDIQFPNDHLFDVIIDPIYLSLSSGQNVDSSKPIHTKMLVQYIQHGMKIHLNGEDVFVKKIFLDEQNENTPFYFMHIYKTSGLSLREELMKYFRGQQVYTNYIGHIDDNELLNSKLISGHFASYPTELYQSYDKELHTVSVFRDPVDRTISHFLYENSLRTMDARKNKDVPTVEDFEEFLADPANFIVIKDLQTKNLTSSMDTELSNQTAESLFEGQSDINGAIMKLGSTSRFISQQSDESNWRKHLQKLSLYGTINNRDKFLKDLHDLLTKEGYRSGSIRNIIINKNTYSTEMFKKMLPERTISHIKDSNQNDMALHEHLLSKGL
jgi:hypothetical protein